MVACACPSMYRCIWRRELGCAVIARGVTAHGWGVGIHISDSPHKRVAVAYVHEAAVGGRSDAGWAVYGCWVTQAECEQRPDWAGAACVVEVVIQARRVGRRCRG